MCTKAMTDTGLKYYKDFEGAFHRTPVNIDKDER